MQMIKMLTKQMNQAAGRVFGMTALIVFVATQCFISKLCVLDPDIWWHLSTGEWILRNGQVPHSGLFTYTATNHPWMAYSWGFEVILARFFDNFSFMGLGIFGVGLTILLALSIFYMLYRISGRFWVSWALSLIVDLAFMFNVAPRPLFVSVISIAFMLALLFQAQRTGRVQLLYWLPLIFLFWANCHIQFIYGFGVLGLLAGVNLLQHLTESLGWHPEFLQKPTLPVVQPLAVLGCCALVVCIGPYSYHLYHEVYVLSQAKYMYRMVSELQAPNFQSYNQFLELLLGIAAYFSIGWRKKIDPFKLALLLCASLFAFRTWRDGWVLCVIAGAVIIDFPVKKAEGDRAAFLTLREAAGVTLATVLLLLVSVRATDFNVRGLDRAISKTYPVDAANFVRRTPLPGPLYNSFDFGGFLTFYLPTYPVSIDGRTDIYGEAMNERYMKTEAADPSYTSDPYLNEAGFVILKNTFPLSKLLAVDPRFRLIYKDDVATVLARNF